MSSGFCFTDFHSSILSHTITVSFLYIYVLGMSDLRQLVHTALSILEVKHHNSFRAQVTDFTDYRMNVTKCWQSYTTSST